MDVEFDGNPWSGVFPRPRAAFVTNPSSTLGLEGIGVGDLACDEAPGCSEQVLGHARHAFGIQYSDQPNA